jgi:hypothetical protein
VNTVVGLFPHQNLNVQKAALWLAIRIVQVWPQLQTPTRPPPPIARALPHLPTCASASVHLSRTRALRLTQGVLINPLKVAAADDGKKKKGKDGGDDDIDIASLGSMLTNVNLVAILNKGKDEKGRTVTGFNNLSAVGGGALPVTPLGDDSASKLDAAAEEWRQGFDYTVEGLKKVAADNGRALYEDVVLLLASTELEIKRNALLLLNELLEHAPDEMVCRFTASMHSPVLQ